MMAKCIKCFGNNSRKAELVAKEGTATGGTDRALGARTQIIQQAAMAILTQANQQTEQILELLKSVD